MVYVGDLRHLVLELRNQSEISVKNLKMKISHSRFLCIGNQENLNMEFPACLEKTTNSEQQTVHTSPNTTSYSTFVFPEDTSIQGGSLLSWPLCFRAAVPGSISLYIIIYYEIEDVSSSMAYRTLRMHYNLQVLPSLDVSFQISPCPSRLQEFLVRMDVMNKTGSEVFQIHQLSSVGYHWELSILQDVDTIFPSRALMAGQTLSCFFMLKNIKKSLDSEDKRSSFSPLLGSDVRLGIHGNDEELFDTFKSPLVDFHHSERLHQESSPQGDLIRVDFILISRPFKMDINTGVPDPPHLFSHHACHCSTSSNSPISWVVDGPRTVYHDFSASFCELKLGMMIYNPSDMIASIRIDTADSANIGNPSGETTGQSATPYENQVGWHDISLTHDIKVTSDIPRAQMGKSLSLESGSQFIWSGSSSARVQLDPLAGIEIPLQVCVFSLLGYVTCQTMFCIGVFYPVTVKEISRERNSRREHARGICTISLCFNLVEIVYSSFLFSTFPLLYRNLEM